MSSSGLIVIIFAFFRRTVYDKTNMEQIKLTDEEIAIIHRIESGKFPEKDFDPYEVIFLVLLILQFLTIFCAISFVHMCFKL